MSGSGTAVVVPVSGSSIDIVNNGYSELPLAKITYTCKNTVINERRKITVDGNTRTYWIYAPENVKGRTDVPVIFSLHGRQGNGADHPGRLKAHRGLLPLPLGAHRGE